MQLSRNNYEEYFLLYIDGELSNTDRLMVEQFVKLHPDLEEELELLKESMLPLDELVQMPGKEQLMKQVEWQEEDITPLRQELFLYLDNELSGERKTELEAQLAKNAELNNELKTLAKARLVADVVEMPSKEELYRSEKDRKPIPIRWTRWVAAAAAVAGLGWFALSVINRPVEVAPEFAGVQTTDGSTKAVEPSSPSSTETAQSGAQQIDEPTKDEASKTVHYAATGADQQKQATKSNALASTHTTNVQNTASKPDERDRLENMSGKLAVSVPPTGVEEGNQHIERNIGTPNINVNPVASTVAVKGNEAEPQKEASPYQYASYNERQDEDPYVNIAGARISKQKLRGVFRTVSRTVTRSFEKSSVTDANNVSSL